MARAARASVVHIVDADASVRDGLARLVASAGLEARPHPSVEHFLDAAVGVESGEGCVLLDLGDRALRLPDVRGRLQRLSATVPLVALTALDDDTVLGRARELGARACFRKPVDASALLDAITWVSQPAAQVR